MAYLFVHFTGEQKDGEQIYFSLSKDGLHWQDIHENRPILVSHIGQKGVRDPFLVRDEKKETYYLMATDLRIESGISWEAAQNNGSTSIIVWESRDLIHWSKERSICMDVPQAGCVWAPEAIYDKEKEQFFVFWTSKVKREEAMKHCIYASYTNDFKQFSTPFLYMEKDRDIIDLTLVENQGTYYRFYKNEENRTISMEKGQELLGEFEPITSEALQKLSNVEGPECYPLEDGSWCLILDCFAAGTGYLPSITKNLESGEFRTLQAEEYDFGSSRKRHGGVILISEEEYGRLREAYPVFHYSSGGSQPGKFYKNDTEVSIISGGIHYFRVVPEYWRDRLEKLKAMGCNAVETYIPWNLHEPEKGNFCFEGRMDIAKFIQTAQELGLYVIVRPSPYICAEWEFGGLPAWMLADSDMHVRTSEENFMQHVRTYYEKLLEILVPLQINYGGAIILLQIENEYGYYGTDSNYLQELCRITKERGMVVPLITADGGYEETQSCGTVTGALPTGNFGSHAKERIEVLKQYNHGGPLMCTEFWVGWFDSWGNGGHVTGNLEQSLEELEQILQVGNVNFYMFEGGTNFGFMNGSNYYEKLEPDVTSYDYDAILTEDGQITKKFKAYQQVIARYAKIPKVSYSTKIVRKSYGTITVAQKVNLFETLSAISKPVSRVSPVSMERIGQNYGYILYRSKLEKEKSLEKIRLFKANDRVQVFVDGQAAATWYDRELLEEQEVSAKLQPNTQIDFLVENMGRVNFGPMMDEQRKGIDGGVQINGHLHHNWDMYPLPLKDIAQVDFSGAYTEGQPAFYRFCFSIEEAGDTFLDFTGFGKGVAFVNGENIGRFWEIGPQKRLYIPAPLLRIGQNEIILFETEGKAATTITLYEEPKL